MNIFMTGGTRGIGRGMVREFQKRGHKVVYTGTSESSILKSGNKDLENTLGLVSNVASRTETLEASKKAIEYLGAIDLWINNAGVNQPFKHVSELTDEEIRRVIDINVTGMINATSIALDIFKKQGYGTVYNMEGLGSNNMVFAGTVIYASSKHLLSFFTKGCNKELKEYNKVSVCTLSPGMVFTDLLKTSETSDGDKIAKIIGSTVEQVTPYFVKKMEKGKKKINYMPTYKIMWRFMTSPFKK